MILLMAIGFPILEAWVFLRAAEQFGGWRAFAWLALDFFVGIAIAQAKGRDALSRASQAMRSGRFSEQALTTDVFGALGGLLIAFPGFVSDVIGAIFLLPGLRSIAAALVRKWIAKQAASGKFQARVRVFGGDFGVGHGRPADFDPASAPWNRLGERDVTPPSRDVIDVSPVSSETKAGRDGQNSTR